MFVIGYIRVSTEEQGASGLGLEAQRHQIEADALRRGWTLVDVIADEGVSGTIAPEKRPGFAKVLACLHDRFATGIVVAKLDRLSRSLAHQTAFIDLALDAGWSLVALDVDIDTSTATGKLVANLMGSVNQHFRDVISERTREALAAKRARGEPVGRPVLLPEDVRGRIVEARGRGLSLRAIADALNADGVVTAQGGARWYASTVSKVLLSVEKETQRAWAGEGREGLRRETDGDCDLAVVE